MTLRINKLSKKNYEATYRILGNSYPDMKIPKDRAFEWFDRINDPNESRCLWGGFLQGQQVSVFVTNDFTMNFRGQMLSAGGIGMVAVDLLHKKEKICKQMIEFYESYYEEKDTYLLVLYPFRPDFYHKMGFGMGTCLHTYCLEPKYFPKYKKTHALTFADMSNLSEITDFYNQITKSQHGAMYRREGEFEGWLRNPQLKCIIYKEDNEIQGYMFFSFRERNPHDKGSFDMIVKEIFFQSVDVWKQFSTFFNSQSDQIKRIEITTYDTDFYHYISNPVSESKESYQLIRHNIAYEKSGLMYKISNPLKFMESLEENAFENNEVIIRLILTNELFPKKEKYILTYNLENSKFVINETKRVDVSIKMNLAQFSSILMGALSFSSAYKHGLIDIDNKKYIDCVDKLFRTNNKPVGYNEF